MDELLLGIWTRDGGTRFWAKIMSSTIDYVVLKTASTTNVSRYTIHISRNNGSRTMAHLERVTSGTVNVPGSDEDVETRKGRPPVVRLGVKSRGGRRV